MITTKRIIPVLIFMFSLALFGGCDNTTMQESTDIIFTDNDIEIEGVWDSNFGSKEIITDTEFLPYSGYVITYDNNANILFFQAKEDDSYNPDKFGRIVWTEITESDGVESFYYCTEVYGKNTLAEAQSDPTTSDSSDPANSGCGGFSWTRLSTPAGSE